MKDILIGHFKERFGRNPSFLARAPGRIEFIGNHTDYNKGSVLGASLDLCVWVAIAPRVDNQRNYFALGRGALVNTSCEVYDRLQGDASWVNYPLGVLVAMREAKLKIPEGFDYLVMSNLPMGAGLSSSAAIELSSALVFLQATNQSVSKEVLVNLGKAAENNFVGVPCGILDQGVSGFGKKDQLVYIDCAGPLFATVPLPSKTHFWIFNTHTKHALVDGLYATRHKECMDAAKTLGVNYLVEVSIEQLMQNKTKLSLNVFKRAKHIVEEIDRVNQMITVLKDGDLRKIGQLLYLSHQSSELYFENSTPELDFIVATLRTQSEVYGARLTGGGFGGAVMALAADNYSQDLAEVVSETYRKKFGNPLEIIHAITGDGASLI